MKQIEMYAFLSDALQSLDGLKEQLEYIREAIGETIDWEAMEGTETHPLLRS